MRKEIIFAIASGILFGLVVAFGIWKANSSIKTSNQQQVSTQKEEETPKAQFGLTIAKPEENTVTNKKTITLSGISKINAWIVISGDEKDYVIQADEKGGFEYEIDLIGGVNEIIVTAFDETGASVEKKEIVVYSTEFEVAQETKPEASPKEEASTSSDAIRNKVQEKVESVINSPKAYIGTVTDLSEGTIQINRFVFSKEESKNNEILQISVKGEPVFVKVAKETKNIKFSDVAIGDFIVAMGFVNGNSVLEAKRVLVTEPLKVSPRKAIFGKVTKISKNEISLNSASNEEVILTPGDDLSITKVVEGKQTKIKWATISDADNLIAVGTLAEKELTARRIHILSSEVKAEEASPSPKVSPTSKEE